MKDKFLNKQLYKINKDLEEASHDTFNEPSDISLTASDAYTYYHPGFRKGFKKASKNTLKMQKNNDPSQLSTSKGRQNIKGNKPKGIQSGTGKHK